MSLNHETYVAAERAEVTLSEARVLADCAFSAGSEDKRQAGAYILEHLRTLFHADAAAILAWNPLAQSHTLVSNLDYSQSTLDGLGEPYTHTDPHSRMLTTRSALRIVDLPYDYRDTEMYQTVIMPVGFRDGMTMCLFTEDRAYAGMIHMSSAVPGTFDSRHPTLLGAIAPSIGKLCTLGRPRGLAVDDSSSRAYVDVTGMVLPLDERHLLTVGAEPDFLRAIESFLGSGDESVIGLWPTPDTWLRVRLDRVNEPLLSSDAIALVTITGVQLPYGLTGREVDVLSGVARGLSNQQIASRHAVSLRTTTTHVERILSKLDERSRTGAAVRAVHDGLIRLND